MEQDESKELGSVKVTERSIHSSQRSSSEYQHYLKNAPTINLGSAHSGHNSSPEDVNYLKNIPIMPLGMIAYVIIALLGSVVLLKCLDGQPQWSERHQINPSVVLSIFHASSMIAINFAAREGGIISWWRRAQGGTTIKQLSRNYHMAISLEGLFMQARGINLMAVAPIAATALGLAQGALLQRSLTIGNSPSPSNIDLQMRIADHVPSGYWTNTHGVTGSYSGFSQNFTNVVRGWSIRSLIQPTSLNCMGTCRANVTGFGYVGDCTSESQPFEIPDLGASLASKTLSKPPYRLWQTSIYTNDSSIELSAKIAMSLSPASGDVCSGRVLTHRCSLRPTKIQYPIIINSRSDEPTSIALDTPIDGPFYLPAMEPQTDEMLTLNVSEGFTQSVKAALNDRFTLQFDIEPAGAEKWRVTSQNSYPYFFIANSTFNATRPFPDSCSLTFLDPTYTILSSINDLLFRMSLAAANGTQTNIKTVPAYQIRDTNVYKVNYSYLGATIALTIVCVLMVCPSLYGWWELEVRKSFDPIDVAASFDAEAVRCVRNFKDSQELIKFIGNRKIIYAAPTSAGMLVSGRKMILVNKNENLRAATI